MRFDQLPLRESILAAVRAAGYEEPTPIQAEAIPHIVEGRDVLACAQTGTGKTAAFALPILEGLASLSPGRGRDRIARVLVLTPTRELASQIDESFRTYGRHVDVRTAVVFGGVGQSPQVRAVRGDVDVIIATPGRLLDLIEQRLVPLFDIDTLVLDEADRMLDQGFLPDVRRILGHLPRDRQTLLFSATMPAEIRKLADDILDEPVHVAVTPPATTADKVEQSVYYVDSRDKRALLLHVVADPDVTRVLVFTRTKHGANRVAEHLSKAGVDAAAIHGNKSQAARERALASFRKGQTRVLVATDIAARGIDVDAVSHVVNFDVPNVPETYVHRIGRTARAGAAGSALSFVDSSERGFLAAIERTIRARVPVVTSHPYHSTTRRPSVADEAPARRQQQRRPPSRRPRQHAR